MVNSILSGCIFIFAGFFSPSLSHSLQHAHASSVEITINQDTTCSATAIGPYALLTAAHCITNMKTLKVDDKEVQILRVDVDNMDHVIVTVKKLFTDISKISNEKPYTGEQIFIFGNPGDFSNLMRVGIVSGHLQKNDLNVTVYDFNGFFGDSGAAVFNEEGNIIGIVNFLLYQNHENVPWHTMAGLPLNFPKNVMDAAISGH